MASIKQCGDKWRVQIKVGGTRASNTFSTEAAARDWATALETRLRKRADLQEVIDVVAGLPHFPKRILEAMASAPLSPDEIVDGSMPKTVLCGIYFLIRDDRIVYVGQSKNALRRVGRHIDDGKDFDRFTIAPCAEEDLDRLERTYITAFYPEQNLTLGNALQE